MIAGYTGPGTPVKWLGSGLVVRSDAGNGVRTDDALPFAVVALDQDFAGTQAGGAVAAEAALAGSTLLALAADTATAAALGAVARPVVGVGAAGFHRCRSFVVHAIG